MLDPTVEGERADQYVVSDHGWRSVSTIHLGQKLVRLCPPPLVAQVPQQDVVAHNVRAETLRGQILEQSNRSLGVALLAQSRQQDIVADQVRLPSLGDDLVQEPVRLVGSPLLVSGLEEERVREGVRDKASPHQLIQELKALAQVAVQAESADKGVVGDRVRGDPELLHPLDQLHRVPDVPSLAQLIHQVGVRGGAGDDA